MAFSRGEPDNVARCSVSESLNGVNAQDQGHFYLNFQDLQLKPEHMSMPLWVSPNGHTFLESFARNYKNACYFLGAIGEKVSLSSSHIQEYRLTPYSLYAAACAGLQTQDIIDNLKDLSKNVLPGGVVDLIKTSTLPFGKIKLVLKNNRYFVESQDPDVIKKLLEVIEECRLRDSVESSADGLTTQHQSKVTCIQFGKPAGTSGEDRKQVPVDASNFYCNINNDEDDEDASSLQMVAFEVKPEKIEVFQERCFQMGYRLLAEYDFRNDTHNQDINIELRPVAVDLLRPYQKESLQKMFEHDRAHSGLIFLPCGTGKSLVGVAACCRVRKRALVLCNSEASVEQWKAQFKMWSTADNIMICRFTSAANDKPHESSIMITTFNMITHQQSRSDEENQTMEWLQEQEWGIMVLDEVHAIPTEMLRSVLTIVQAHCKLGLTNPLVPKGDIEDLNFVIGPKLYEANMLELQEGGFLARVQCSEVQCPMNPEFLRKYLACKSTKKMLLFMMDPNKFRACQFLIRYHERRNEKIIVFSENFYPLKHYALTMNKPFICSSTPLIERNKILDNFGEEAKTIFVSKGIADTSLNLPDADVLIQISSNGGSACQGAQRLGRILQAKKGAIAKEYTAFFYTLALQNSVEMTFCFALKEFLINQGYSFKPATHLEGMDQDQELNYKDKEEQENLLQMVLAEIYEDEECV